MLRRLTVSNFAVVSELSIEFAPGLNVLTGETGAGKSILIESLGFLLGGRGSQSWLRAGAQRLIVEGVFAGRLARRELDRSGRTRAFLDGRPVSVADLADFGGGLVDFHGQHEHQTLLKPAVQVKCLDVFGSLEKEARAAAEAYAVWAALKAERDAEGLSEEERASRLELWRFQKEELDAAGLRAGEEEELSAVLPRLQGAEKLRGLAEAVYEALYRRDGSALELLQKAQKNLEDICRIDESLIRERDALQAASLAAEEAARAVGAYRQAVEADPARLEKAFSRLDQLSRLKKKHAAAAVSDLLNMRQKLAEDIARLDGAGRSAEELEGKLAEAEGRLERACAVLHKERLKAARELSGALLKELKALGMAQARFEVEVEMEEGRYGASGCDEVEFLIAVNPGEPLRPVRTVASGGELSRLMLALKTVLADEVPVLVFDEVDAGIGGVVARAVGQRLERLSRSRQVLCVTHLPQVACFARGHFQVSKDSFGGRTQTRVEPLSGARRLEVLAQMLGGRRATEASRRHAQELLESALA